MLNLASMPLNMSMAKESSSLVSHLHFSVIFLNLDFTEISISMSSSLLSESEEISESWECLDFFGLFLIFEMSDDCPIFLDWSSGSELNGLLVIMVGVVCLLVCLGGDFSAHFGDDFGDSDFSDSSCFCLTHPSNVEY